MNFEFLKGLRGLQYVYENCSNAEKLAISMPVQSVFTSRKSAELLAKFIYMAAHNQAMQGMTFVDILSDPTVCRVVNSRKVMNAFHHIRKGGNRAVHGDEHESPEEAVSILHDLHYVAGETACILGLIDQYPRFDESIESHPEAHYVDETDIEEKAQKMFLDYVEKYNAQEESENYYKTSVDSLSDEFRAFCSPFEWHINLLYTDEIIEFKSKPVLQKTVKQIQEHFGRFGMQGLRHLRGEVIDERGFDYKAELTLYGEDGYTTTNLMDFMNGLMHDLPNADGFKIVSHYFGQTPLLGSEILEYFEETIPKIGEHEQFTYSYHEYLFIDGEDYFAKYENGKWIDLKGLYTPEIINRKSDQLWGASHLYLYLNFDFDAHKDILKTLRTLVRDRISEENLQFMEDIWEEGEDDSMLLGNVAWNDLNFQEVRSFLDEVHRIIKPIMNECDGGASGEWFLNDDPFAVATLEWTKDGFRIIGTSY